MNSVFRNSCEPDDKLQGNHGADQREAAALQRICASTNQEITDATTIQDTLHPSDVLDGERVSSALCAEETIKSICSLPKGVRESTIGWMLKYFVLFPDGFQFSEFVQSLSAPIAGSNLEMQMEDRAHELMLVAVQRKLGLSEVESIDSMTKIATYANRHFRLLGRDYHGFNPAFEQSIRTHGLHTQERLWNWDSMREVHEILEKFDAGYALCQGPKDEGRVCLSETPTNTYSYAAGSPEWFGVFVETGSKWTGNQQAFERRDYSSARANIEAFCKELMDEERPTKPRMTEQEKGKVIDFFDRCWKLFVTSDDHPKVALVRKSASDSGCDASDWEQGYKQDESRQVERLVRKGDPKRIVECGVHHYSNNLRMQHDIAASDIVIVNLPPYHRIFPKTETAKR